MSVKMNLEINTIKIREMKDGYIYSNIEATKITSDWYLWMHHTIDKIPSENKKKNIYGKKNIQKIKQEQKIVINLQKLKKMTLKKNMRRGNKIFI